MPDCGLSGLTFTEPSLTKPQFAKECDLHTIIDRFMRTGQLPASSPRPTIDDATGSPGSFDELMQNAVAVQQSFDALPADERAKFDNDPAVWLQALQESEKQENKDEQDKIKPPPAPAADDLQEVHEDSQS